MKYARYTSRFRISASVQTAGWGLGLELRELRGLVGLPHVWGFVSDFVVRCGMRLCDGSGRDILRGRLVREFCGVIYVRDYVAFRGGGLVCDVTSSCAVVGCTKEVYALL